MRTYAGIGSKTINGIIKNEFMKIGSKLATLGYILRSGGSKGADLAFEQGCDAANGLKEVFVPWVRFNGNKSTLILPQAIPELVVSITQQVLYPHWNKVSEKMRRLYARNVYQILGEDLNSPAKFVVCYTEKSYNDLMIIDETLFSPKLAEQYNIPVYNFFVRGAREQFYNMFEKLK